MKEGISGTLKAFAHRKGGYMNYQYDTSHPENNESEKLLSKEEADCMLEDANTFIEKYCPRMGDFVIFQLEDGTIRLDVADRAFLGG